MESDRKRTNSSELEEGEANELLQLQWSNHSTAFGTALNILRSDDTFCDVTLITSEGEHFSAHKVIISACSSHLRSMLKLLPRWQHPVLIMPKDVPMDDLRDIITFMYSGEVHVERGRLESFLHSAELLKVHGLCDQVNNQKTKPQPSKKVKKSAAKSTVVTTTITPAFPLRPSSRNSPKAGPSVLATPKVKSPNTASSSLAVKLEEPNYSDEENLPEHMVIPSDPNSIRVTKQEALFDENYGNCATARHPTEEDSIAADSPMDSGDKKDNLVVLFAESARCHFCALLCPDRATLKTHLQETHQPPRHALCENCENFFHICAITRHKAKCMERYQHLGNDQQTDNKV